MEAITKTTSATNPAFHCVGAMELTTGWLEKGNK